MTEKYRKVTAAVIAVIIVISIFVMAAEPGSAITVNGTAVKYNRLQFVYSTSTTGSTTTISWELWCNRTKSGYDTFKKSAATVVKINGVTLANTNTYYDVRNGSKKLLSGTYAVARTNGAAKNVSFSASVNLSGTSVGGAITVSGTIALPAYTAGTKDVTANIDWIDNGNVGSGRPETVTVTLYQDGTEYKSAEVSTEENSVTFAGVPLAYGGKAYVYTVGGSETEGYLVSEPAASEIVYKYSRVPELRFRIGFTI